MSGLLGRTSYTLYLIARTDLPQSYIPSRTSISPSRVSSTIGRCLVTVFLGLRESVAKIYLNSRDLMMTGTALVIAMIRSLST